MEKKIYNLHLRSPGLKTSSGILTQGPQQARNSNNVHMEASSHSSGDFFSGDKLGLAGLVLSLLQLILHGGALPLGVCRAQWYHAVTGDTHKSSRRDLWTPQDQKDHMESSPSLALLGEKLGVRCKVVVTMWNSLLYSHVINQQTLVEKWVTLVKSG